MGTTETLRAGRTEVSKQVRGLLEDAGREDRDLSDDEKARWETLAAEGEILGERIEREERTTSLERELATPVGSPPVPMPEPPARSLAPAFHQKEEGSYSLLSLFRALKSGDARQARLERRASDEIAERVGREPEGQFVPYRALMPLGYESRDVDKGGTGAALVGTDLIPSEFIELLRNQSQVVQAGARMIPNLVGDVDLPRQSAGAAAVWLAAETTDLTTDTTFATDTVSLTPKTVGIRADVTRRMLKQSSTGIEEVIRQDVRQQIGVAVDSAAINGSGASGQPTGVLNAAGTGSVTITGTGTWAEVVELETDVGGANALNGSLAYMMRHAQAGAFKTTLVDSGSGRYLMEVGGSISALASGQRVNGYPAFVTEQAPATTVIFGNWAELLIGMWGVLDVFADQYTLGDRGGLVVRGFQDMDIALRHGASFSILA